MPHLFLRPAQKDDIADCSALASENAAPKVEEFVDGGEDRTASDIIAEINDPVTHLEPSADRVVQLGEAQRLATNGGDRPYTPGGPQPGESPRPASKLLRRGPARTSSPSSA